MIAAVEVVHRRVAQALACDAGVALIALGTPGCAIAAPPGLRALCLHFDSLAGELEAASLRLACAAPAVPFTHRHARQLAAFLAGLWRDSASIALLVTESEGVTRSVTVARWVTQRFGSPLREPPSAARVASCALMARVLDGVAPVDTADRADRSACSAAPPRQALGWVGWPLRGVGAGVSPVQSGGVSSGTGAARAHRCR